MDSYVSKLHKDLKTKLESLCWMHNKPAWYVSEYFAELRRQVDLDAERIIEELMSTEEEVIINAQRMEFIRILEELEKRIPLRSKPQLSSSEVYSSLKQRVNEFKDSSSSLDETELKESYVQLAQEILDQIDRVEKGILGRQTIVYWPPRHNHHLGSLIYFSDVFLSQRQIDSCLIKYERHLHRSVSLLLVPVRECDQISKSNQVIKSLSEYEFRRFGKTSKFFCVAKSDDAYWNYYAERSSLESEFISYQIIHAKASLQIPRSAYLDTSENLFDIYSSNACELRIENLRLEGLHYNLLPSPIDRLTQLKLIGVHLEPSFDIMLFAKFTSLMELKLQATFSKDVRFDLEFLRPLRELQSLELTLPGSSWNFDAFKNLPKLRCLKLESSAFYYAEKLPSLSKAALEQILSAPLLDSLGLSYFDIDTFDWKMLGAFRTWNLCKNRISNISCHGPVNFISFHLNPAYLFKDPSYTTSINLIHSGIRFLGAASFAGMTCLRELSLTGNSIVDLPCGVFQKLPSLATLRLDKNLTTHIRRGVFGKLDKLDTLTLDGNPIESIEANAFAELNSLRRLTLDGCRLKSIDSEMFNGLKSLDVLRLNDNLIERIEVIAEDGRRINVAKADLNNEERELVKKHLFADMVQVWLFDLSRNKLEKLDLNCFGNLESLRMIDLSSNKINELDGKAEPELLANFKILCLNDNQLETIDKRALPKTLTRLNLSKNKLKRLDEDFFADFSALKDLCLDQNELTWTITDATFHFCTFRYSFKSLNLLQNESIRITETALAQISNLRHIECDFSEHCGFHSLSKTLRIRKLTPEVIRTLQNKSKNSWKPGVCCISDCSIKALTRNPVRKNVVETPETEHFNLRWLPDTSLLRELDFSRNLIETLDDQMLFTDLYHILEINLSGNRLSRLHRSIFRSSPYISTIDLSGNKLSSIDIGLFRHLEKLKHLNLSSNSITFLNLARFFRNCPSLVSLNIADNQLDDRSTAETIDDKAFCCLEELILANNCFENMDFIRDMTSLQHLDLRSNRIESVMSNGENLLGRFRSLTYLNLSGNKISSLTAEMFAHLRGQLNHLDLSGNPTLDSVQLD